MQRQHDESKENKTVTNPLDLSFKKTLSCPITTKIFYNPVINGCGHTLESEAISECKECPTCKKPIENTIPNLIMQEQLTQLIEHFSELQSERYFSNYLLKNALKENNKVALDELCSILETSKNAREKHIAYALMDLVLYPLGCAKLKEDNKLRQIITPGALNYILTYDSFAGRSALSYLTSIPLGYEILTEDKILRDKITSQGLNSIELDGDHEGKSALFWLVNSDKTLKLLTNDENLRNKITPTGLNTVCVNSDIGKSALYLMTCCPAGQELLVNDPNLRAKIEPTGLNSIIQNGPHSGKSTLFNLASTPEGRKLLIEDKDLRAKISAKGLNEISNTDPFLGHSPLSLLATYPEGRKLLIEDDLLRRKIAPGNLSIAPMGLTHDTLVDLIEALKYPTNRRGMCYGYSVMGILAMQSKDLSTFEQRIKHIEKELTIKKMSSFAETITRFEENRIKKLKINKLRLLNQLQVSILEGKFFQFLETQRNSTDEAIKKAIHAYDQANAEIYSDQLHEMRPFLESLTVFYDASKFPDLFDDVNRPTGQDASKTFIRGTPAKIENRFQQEKKSDLKDVKEEPLIQKMDTVMGLYSVDELTKLFNLLRSENPNAPDSPAATVLSASGFDPPLGFLLQNMDHAISVVFDNEARCWQFFDANALPRAVISYPSDRTLAEKIKSAFANDNLSLIYTEIFCLNDQVDKVNAWLPELKKTTTWHNLHKIEGKEHLFDSKQNSLFTLALERNNIELAKEIYESKKIDINSVHNGVSTLLHLTGNEQGQKWFAQDANLRASITPEGLNSVYPTEQHLGRTALYWIVGNPNGRILLEDDKLREKITSQGLNSICKGGIDDGKSALYFIAGNASGVTLLSKDKNLRDKITSVGLNNISSGKKDCPLYWLTQFPLGRQLLMTDNDLRAKITSKGLNNCHEEKSALFTIVDSPEGPAILSDPNLIMLIDFDALTNHKNSSAIFKSTTEYLKTLRTCMNALDTLNNTSQLEVKEDELENALSQLRTLSQKIPGLMPEINAKYQFLMAALLIFLAEKKPENEKLKYREEALALCHEAQKFYPDKKVLELETHLNKLNQKPVNVLVQQSQKTLDQDDRFKQTLLCPVTKQLLLDPVITGCGHSFARNALSNCKDCPTCKKPVEKIIPNLAMKEYVKQLMQHYPALGNQSVLSITIQELLNRVGKQDATESEPKDILLAASFYDSKPMDISNYLTLMNDLLYPNEKKIDPSIYIHMLVILDHYLNENNDTLNHDNWHNLIAVSLFSAVKFWDPNYSNANFATAAGIELNDINMFENEFLDHIRYKPHEKNIRDYASKLNISVTNLTKEPAISSPRAANEAVIHIGNQSIFNHPVTHENISNQPAANDNTINPSTIRKDH